MSSLRLRKATFQEPTTLPGGRNKAFWRAQQAFCPLQASNLHGRSKHGGRTELAWWVLRAGRMRLYGFCLACLAKGLCQENPVYADFLPPFPVLAVHLSKRPAACPEAVPSWRAMSRRPAGPARILPGMQQSEKRMEESSNSTGVPHACNEIVSR